MFSSLVLSRDFWSMQFWCPFRQHKKLNLLIEFSDSIFIKFYFKAFWQKPYSVNPHSIWKLNLSSKTDISKTAWINPWSKKFKYWKRTEMKAIFVPSWFFIMSKEYCILQIFYDHCITSPKVFADIRFISGPRLQQIFVILTFSGVSRKFPLF